jgi:hypothetical protein
MVQLADAVRQLEHWPRGVAVILRGQVYATLITPTTTTTTLLLMQRCIDLLAYIYADSTLCCLQSCRTAKRSVQELT